MPNSHGRKVVKFMLINQCKLTLRIVASDSAIIFVLIEIDLAFNGARSDTDTLIQDESVTPVQDDTLNTTDIYFSPIETPTVDKCAIHILLKYLLQPLLCKIVMDEQF